MDEFDDLRRRQDEHIDRVGWSVTMVMPTDDDPGTPFAYTVGLTGHDLPELIIAGLPPRVAHTLLNDLAAWSSTKVYGSATGSASVSSWPATTRSSSTGPPPTCCIPAPRTTATAPTGSGCNRSSGPTRRAGSRGSPATRTTHAPSPSSGNPTPEHTDRTVRRGPVR